MTLQWILVQKINFLRKSIIFPSFHNWLPLFCKSRSVTMVMDKKHTAKEAGTDEAEQTPLPPGPEREPGQVADAASGGHRGDPDVLHSHGRHRAGFQGVQLPRRYLRQPVGGVQELRVLLPVGQGVERHPQHHPVQPGVSVCEHLLADHLRHPSLASWRASGSSASPSR